MLENTRCMDTDSMAASILCFGSNELSALSKASWLSWVGYWATS